MANLLSANASGIETSSAGWSAQSNCTIARSTAQAYAGSASLEITPTTTTTCQVDLDYASWPTNIKPGAWYSGHIRIRPNVSGTSMDFTLQWRTSADAFISSVSVTGVSLTANQWNFVAVPLSQAPATAAKAYLILVPNQVATSDRFYVDEVFLGPPDVAFDAIPGVSQPGSFWPGSIGEVASVAKSSSDTGTGTEAVVTIAVSSSDTGSGTDTGSVATDNTPSSSDTVTSSETQTITVIASDTGSGTDTTSSIKLTGTDTVSGDDTQAISAFITQVGSATTDTAANGTSVTANKPTGLVEGQLLLACLTSNDQSVTAPTGWTEFQNDKGTNAFRNRLYYKVAGASEPASYTFSVASAAPLVLTITGWANADQSNPIGSTNHIQTGGGSTAEPYTTPNLTTNNAVNGRVMYTRACRLSGSTPITFTASSVTEISDVGVFSGGTVCYSHAWYTDTSDFSSNGATKNGIDITANASETDNVGATFVVRAVTTTVFIEQEDTGSGTDSESIPSATLTHTDTVSSSETNSRTATLSSADTGSGTETNSIVANFSSSDTASGVEGTALIAFTRTETGAGLDSQSVQDQTNPSSNDTVSSVETHSIVVSFTQTDIVVGTDFGDSPGDVPAVLGDFQVTLVLGPATIYVADYGTLEPTTTDPLSSPWVDLGGTLDGVTLKVKQEFEQKSVTQISSNPASRLKKRDMSVETNLAEPGLQNILFALNQGSLTTGAGYKSYQPPMIDRATPLTYRTIIIDGWAPGFNTNNKHKRRRVILRKAIAVEGTSVSYSKDKQTTQSVSWSVHNINSSTAPFKIIDED